MMQLVYDNSRFGFDGVVPSYCRLRIWRNGPKHDPTVRAVIIASDPDDEECGTSITNAAEAWASLARDESGVRDLDRLLFVEHYPHLRSPEPETFDAIDFSEAGSGALHAPAWTRISRAWVEAAIEGDLD